MNQTKKRKEQWIENEKPCLWKGEEEQNKREEKNLSSVHLRQWTFPWQREKQEQHISMMRAEGIGTEMLWDSGDPLEEGRDIL